MSGEDNDCYYPFCWNGLFLCKRVIKRGGEIPMAKSSGSRSGGNRSGKGGNQGTGKGRGPAGWPSKNPGKPSGGRRNNAPSKAKNK